MLFKLDNTSLEVEIKMKKDNLTGVCSSGVKGFKCSLRCFISCDIKETELKERSVALVHCCF